MDRELEALRRRQEGEKAAHGLMGCVFALWGLGILAGIAFWVVVIWGIVEAILWLRAQ